MNTKQLIKQSLIMLGLMAGAIALMSVLSTTAFAALAEPVNPFKDLPQDSNVKPLIIRIVNYALTFLGIVAVIMIIFAGIKYITAGGKQESVDSAKRIILYSLIGIIIILLSYAIVNTVIGAASEEVGVITQ